MPERRPRSRLPLPGRLVDLGARGAERAAQATGVDRAVEDRLEAAVVRAIDSEATERVLTRALESPAVERALVRALDSPGVERAVIRVLDSALVDSAWERLLQSEEVQQLVERIAEAPEVRSAIASQGAGLLGDIGREIMKVSRRVDASLESFARRILRRPRRTDPSRGAGLLSRGLGAAVDIAILNGIFLATGALLSLAVNAIFPSSGFSGPAIAVGGAAWLALGGIYLVSFWSLSGQTPGMRFLGLSLQSPDGRRIGRRRALRRLAGTVASVLTLGLGFLGAVLSDRRRTLADRWADTEVLYPE